MEVVSGGLWFSSKPRCGSIESSESVLVSGDEIQQGEALLFGCFVEADEGLFDLVDEVFGALQELEELSFPEGGLERESAEGSALSDDGGEFGGVLVLLGEDLKVVLLLVDPVLA